MDIRHSSLADEPAIRSLHEKAFGPQEGPIIAALAIALLHDPTARPVLSLLAFDAGTLIGHILFTRVCIADSELSLSCSILAPLAVLPDRQGQGIGTRLGERGLELLKESGCGLVFVLGHPGYYPRFGFQPAGRLGFTAPYPILEKNSDAWMVLELCNGLLGREQGTIQCADVLDRQEYWRE